MSDRFVLLAEGRRLVVPPRSDHDREAYSRWLVRAIATANLNAHGLAEAVEIDEDEVSRLLDRTYNTSKASRTDVHAYVLRSLMRLCGEPDSSRESDVGPPGDTSLVDEDGVLRGIIHTLPRPSDCSEPPAAYRHQLDALRRLENGADISPPISGIVHLPTGAGKTRVALEFIARRLTEDPSHRFIWATDARELISQTMRKAFEFARRFPEGTTVAWYDGDDDLLRSDAHITFITRWHLRTVLEAAHMSRSAHPWRARVSAGKPTTVVYDECHQLGAEGLQAEMERFYRKVLGTTRAHRWRVIGLSATPIPTREEARDLLKETIFPVRHEQANSDDGWGMHVFHRITNNALIADGVLCPVNMTIDESGIFDIPSDLMRRVVKDKNVRAPGAQAHKSDVMKYAATFNKTVMSDDRVLSFLAERLANNVKMLGKTIVFSPTIDAANRLVAKINAFPGMFGHAAAVHSKMTQAAYSVPNQVARTPGEVLERFRQRSSEPCILVNVEMLTEGFDDPLVQTVVLAKLTLSTNRFWQMIGRGTRGLLAGGTSHCYVVDPIKLVRLYDYFGGYQPTVGSDPGQGIEDDDEETGPGALDPRVPAVSRPPLPSKSPYRVSADLRRLHSSVAAAIDAFLRGGRMDEQTAVEVAANSGVTVDDGSVVMGTASSGAGAETGPVLVHEMVVRMRTAMSADLNWLELQIPSDMAEDLLRYWMRKLAAIEQLGIRTVAEYARAEMDGRLGAFLSTPAKTPPEPAPLPSPPEERPVIEPGTTAADVAALCMAVAHADGVVHPAEVELAGRAVAEGAGVPTGPELLSYLHGTHPSAEEVSAAAGRLVRSLGVADRKKLVRDLVSVAAADSVIHPSEVELIVRAAASLGALDGYAEGLLDARA